MTVPNREPAGGCVSDASSTNGLVVVAWKRFGHDRLYVTSADGTKLGFRDNNTGLVTVTNPDDHHAVQQAVNHYGGQQVELGGGHHRTVRTDSAPVVFNSHGGDLASRLPGAGARSKAAALSQARASRTMQPHLVQPDADERSWSIGADGEEIVAEQLRLLGDRWKVLHSVPVGSLGSDIDHVVIGPGGIFTINTKNLPHSTIDVYDDEILVDRYSGQFVRNSVFEASRTSRFLGAALHAPVHVSAIVVFCEGLGTFTVHAQPTRLNVAVTTASQVTRWLLSLEEVISEADVDAVFSVARRPATWH